MTPLMTRAFAVCLATAFALGGAAAALMFLPEYRSEGGGAQASATSPRWSEVAWPFPMDEWGRGVAFRCTAADCGTEVNLYLRAKIGFCNCATGVADDEELDRLSDFGFLGPAPAPLGAGHPIRVAWMTGRARAFALGTPGRTGRAAISAAFNDGCDAVVATVVSAHERAEAIEPRVLEFLNGATVKRWTQTALGL